jgi:hypothetical protein
MRTFDSNLFFLGRPLSFASLVFGREELTQLQCSRRRDLRPFGPVHCNVGRQTEAFVVLPGIVGVKILFEDERQSIPTEVSKLFPSTTWTLRFKGVGIHFDGEHNGGATNSLYRNLCPPHWTVVIGDGDCETTRRRDRSNVFSLPVLRQHQILLKPLLSKFGPLMRLDNGLFDELMCQVQDGLASQPQDSAVHTLCCIVQSLTKATRSFVQEELRGKEGDNWPEPRRNSGWFLI